MKQKTVAVFEMGMLSHFLRIRPLVALLVEAGLDVCVFSDSRLEAEIRAVGGRFVDLYAGRSVDFPDNSVNDSRAARHVSFAGHYADGIIAETAALNPDVVVADTFAVIGSVVAKALGLPYVNVCAGHNVDPAAMRARLQDRGDPAPGSTLAVAIEILRDRHGIEDASQFSWFTGRSSLLNVYCEPACYLPEETRRVFEPIAFFGSLEPPPEPKTRNRAQASAAPGEESRIYVCFGTITMETLQGRFLPAAMAAITAIAEAIADRPRARGIVSLGGMMLDPDEVDALRKPNVTVLPFVDQCQVLAGADLFFTHHGLNSTHESIFYRVPMISYPFFFDQPSLAQTCERFGLALPLTETLRATVEREDVERALDRYAASREELLANLDAAREWELEVIAARPDVVRRIVELC